MDKRRWDIWITPSHQIWFEEPTVSAIAEDERFPNEDVEAKKPAVQRNKKKIRISVCGSEPSRVSRCDGGTKKSYKLKFTVKMVDSELSPTKTKVSFLEALQKYFQAEA